MESSFIDYRDKTRAESDSDTEIIDDSIDESFILTTKTPLKKNHTVIPDSEESLVDDESDEVEDKVSKTQAQKPVKQQSIQESVVYSSDDGASKQASRAQSQSQNMSYTNVDPSSSEEDAVSPELVPKRRPPPRPKSLNSSTDSPVVRRVKKRMILLDSDTDNSIIIEKNKNNKMKCMKDTPLKIENGKVGKGNDSEESDASDDSGTEGSDEDDEDDESDETDDAADEDQMAMSRATRMSIMGIIPKQNESDESDFIESDDSLKRSIAGSTESLTELPAVDLTCQVPAKLTTPAQKPPQTTTEQQPLKTPEKPETENLNDSVLTCSPIASPLHNITNELNNSKPNSPVLAQFTPRSIEQKSLKDKVLSKLIADDAANKENARVDDDDVTVIDSVTDVITLSSDDDEEYKKGNKGAHIKKSPKTPKAKADSSTSQRSKDNTIRQYLPPPSYPNQVVYVKKHVRDNELNKLNGLQADLQNIRNLLENMDVTTLPDGGSRLIMRLTDLEEQVRRQGDRVGNMVVEPSQPAPADVARDGFGQGLSWDDLQKASNAVQPRMFGKQAMSTHLAERNLILDRLRDLHESLASRPPEEQLDKAPSALKTALMPHQLHALAWLRWRETQRPAGGILADDMGLGKTITMISLIASDKEIRDDDDDDSEEDDGEKPRGRLVKGGTLVVCPASLMSQWRGEVKKHCLPHRISTCLHHGAARAAQPQRLAHCDMVMTTYNILQRDSEKQGVLMRVQWRRVILDEGHIVRNHKSATSRAVCGLRARRRWALTGTPVHNKDLDLFALLKYLRCTPFDDLAMWKKWIDNKSQGGQERLSTIMRCILLRRTKAQLQAKGQLVGLPSRTAHDKHVSLSKEELNVYQKVLVFSKTLFAQFLHQRAEKQADGGFLSAAGNAAYDNMHKKMIALQGAKPVKSHEILVLLLRLRQVCCHCGLIAAMLDPEDAAADVVEDEGGKDLLAELNKLTLEDAAARGSGEKEQEEPEQEGTTAAEAIRSVLAPNNPVFQLERRSSKIQAVMDCLNENVLKHPGEKAVVVSQWTSVLRLVERELAAARVRSATLSGAVPVPARAALVADLNNPASGVRVMLLSLCAGGVGLNLCGANHLLLLDPHWNPQLEQQAQDRVYRVGQHRPVHVYRFMCVDTVEQSIRKLQDAKLELAENVLTGARHTSASKLSIEDLKLLFNMGPVQE
ncbi:LOW QUALITY PROTEIN: transcription termination factor 2-like [Choristoneura fumiferana]